jgi:glycosyltransferase involved in cell wall biosynthesis
MSAAALVSVVVPAYQAERFLDEALGSALAQDHPAIEVIVVDDGSTDATAEIAQRRGVRLIRRPHQGVASARNAGVAASSGEYLTILDADDLWPVNRVSLQVAHLRAHPERGIVMGLTDIFLTPGEQQPAHCPARVDDGPVPGVAGTMLARREVFAAVGLFDEKLSLCEDIDWLARAKDAGITAGALDEVLLHYRIHSLNSSRNNHANVDVLLDVIRRTVRRQRGGARA